MAEEYSGGQLYLPDKIKKVLGEVLADCKELKALTSELDQNIEERVTNKATAADAKALSGNIGNIKEAWAEFIKGQNDFETYIKSMHESLEGNGSSVNTNTSAYNEEMSDVGVSA